MVLFLLLKRRLGECLEPIIEKQWNFFFFYFFLQLLNVQHESWIFENLKKISFQNNLKNQKILNLYGGNIFFLEKFQNHINKRKSRTFHYIE